MINPFEGFGRPVTGERLIGREAIVEDIYNALVAGANYSISGIHRIGKTSIGKEVLNRISCTCSEIRCATITLGTLNSESELFYNIADELFEDDYFDLSSPEQAWREFKKIMRHHGREGRSVIMLDEMDYIKGLTEDISELLINRLRELAHDSKYNVSFLFISARTLQSIQEKCRGSNLSGICHNRSVGPLPTVKEMDCFLSRANIQNKELSEMLFRLTGGHPFLTELLLYSAITHVNRTGDTLNADILQEVMYECSSNFMDYYRNLERFLEDWVKGSWDKLCDCIIGPMLEKVDEGLLDNFRRYGLIKNEIMPWGIGMSQHFQEYISHKRRTAPVWPMIGDIEYSLRNLIKNALFEDFKENWVTEAMNRDPFYAEIFGKLRELMLKEQKIHGLGNSSDILEYAYPGTLKDIILHDWKKYQKTFEDSKKRFIDYMDAICIVRNPLAHNRKPELISPQLIDAAKQACNAIQTLLANNRERVC
jgi:hypothetical protein